jgi:hypothetical protein
LYEREDRARGLRRAQAPERAGGELVDEVREQPRGGRIRIRILVLSSISPSRIR